MYFDHLIEVMPLNRQFNRQGYQLGVAKIRPAQELPKIQSLLAFNTEIVKGATKNNEVFQSQRGFNLWLLVFPEKGFDALIVMLGCVNVPDDAFISFLQCVHVHYRQDVR